MRCDEESRKKRRKNNEEGGKLKRKQRIEKRKSKKRKEKWQGSRMKQKKSNIKTKGCSLLLPKNSSQRNEKKGREQDKRPLDAKKQVTIAMSIQLINGGLSLRQHGVSDISEPLGSSSVIVLR